MGDKCNSCTICSQKCFGVDNNHGSCCSIENRDYILGPVYEVEVDIFVKKLSEKLGREMTRKDVFIDYEEGKNLLPDRSYWQQETSYPAFRINFFDPKRPCIFYNTNLRYCTVYDIRPSMCRDYECNYLMEQKLDNP
jgi:Fe-S-cluster containining protein